MENLDAHCGRNGIVEETYFSAKPYDSDCGFIAVSVLFPGTVIQTYVSANGTVTTEKYSVFTLQASGATKAFPLFIQTVLLCIGTFAFRITGSEKPLGWTIVAAALGIAIYALLIFTQNEVHISWFVPILLVIEWILSIGYKIGRHIGVLA